MYLKITFNNFLFLKLYTYMTICNDIQYFYYKYMYVSFLVCFTLYSVNQKNIQKYYEEQTR